MSTGCSTFLPDRVINVQHYSHCRQEAAAAEGCFPGEAAERHPKAEGAAEPIHWAAAEEPQQSPCQVGPVPAVDSSSTMQDSCPSLVCCFSGSAGL